MSQNNQTFKAADIGKRFTAACIQFDELLASANSPELTKTRHKLRDGMKEYKQQGTLTVAFIGQYSAGKSTIISALTGRRDIHIDTDIATDKTAPYDWNGIRVIDTPGLFTDRHDHDDITYEAIAKADLLVFCLTYMLFDTLTVENFKKLAYDKGYRWKMMLVINKMSAAAGEEDQKIASYRHSLATALKPYGLDEFPISFIDARDYCAGVDENADFLVEDSRFDSFITELNHFVERRASLAKFDTPVRIVLGCIDDAQIGFARNSNEDTAFLEVLSRISRRINQERERLRTRIKSITLDMSAAIANEGSHLASAVGEATFEELNKQSEINVRNHYEETGKALEREIEKAIQSIQHEVEAELQSNLTQAFIAQLNFNGDVAAKNATVKLKQQQVQGQVEWLQEIGQKVGAKIVKTATRETLKTAQTGQTFLRSADVVGSGLHWGVLKVGEIIGFKFKPWQAVGIAKNIGNAAMFLGPALAVFSVGMDLHAMHREREQERQMADIRRDIVSQFKAIAVDLEQQIEAQLREFESQVYGQLEKNIDEARQNTESAMAASHSELGQLAAIRRELEALIQEVQKIATPAVF
jgi:ethanolamine utilization protein EutP (predicted NTPase)